MNKWRTTDLGRWSGFLTSIRLTKSCRGFGICSGTGYKPNSTSYLHKWRSTDVFMAHDAYISATPLSISHPYFPAEPALAMTPFSLVSSSTCSGRKPLTIGRKGFSYETATFLPPHRQRQSTLVKSKHWSRLEKINHRPQRFLIHWQTPAPFLLTLGHQ